MENKLSIPKSDSDLLLESWGYNLTNEYFTIISWAEFSCNFPVLEIATGSGRAVSVLTRLGYNIISGDYDLSKKKEAEARITLPFLDKVSFLQLNIEKIHFGDESFNNVACLNTMHELENPLTGLLELIRVVKPAGKLLVADFNSTGFDVMDKLHLTKFNELHPRGKISSSEIKDVLQKHFTKVSVIETKLNTAFLAENKIINA